MSLIDDAFENIEKKKDKKFNKENEPKNIKKDNTFKNIIISDESAKKDTNKFTFLIKFNDKSYVCSIELASNPQRDRWSLIDLETRTKIPPTRINVRDSVSSREKLAKIINEQLNIKKSVALYILNNIVSKLPRDIEEDEESDEEKPQFNFTPLVVTENEIYEQCYRNGETFYLSNKNEIFGQVDEFVPVDDLEIVREGVVLLPDRTEEYESLDKLLDEIKNHIHKWVDISPQYEEFSSYYVLLSWLFDKLSSLCYLRIMGDLATGKSRFLDVVGRICYRPIIVAGALTSAVVYRALHLWKGTLIVDESDFKRTDEAQEIIKILNVGFERNRASIMRCNPNDPSKIDTFKVFGTKILSSRKPFDDKALESRCLTENMMQTTRKDIKPILTRDFYEKEKDLRRKLLKFRFDYYFKTDFEYKEFDLGDISPRLKQATNSFAVLFQADETIFKKFKKFMEKYNEELVLERGESYEGGVLSAFALLLMNGKRKISAKDIRETLIETYKWEKASTGRIGKTIKSLGFTTEQKRTDSGVRRVFVLDWNKIKNVFKNYFLPDNPVWEMEEICSSVADVADVTGVGSQKSLINKSFEKISEKKKCIKSMLAPTTTATTATLLQDKVIDYIQNDGNESRRSELITTLLFELGEVEDVPEAQLDEIIDTLIADGRIHEVSPGILRLV